MFQKPSPMEKVAFAQQMTDEVEQRTILLLDRIDLFRRYAPPSPKGKAFVSSFQFTVYS